MEKETVKEYQEQAKGKVNATPLEHNRTLKGA